jgi:hypothetical protein
MMTYSQYYAQFVKEHEKELQVLFTSHPKGDFADGETVEHKECASQAK